MENRDRFIYSLSAWRETCTQAQAPLAPKADRNKLRIQTRKIKRLEVELRRKEKALAEAAALLILQKKSAHSGRSQRTNDQPGGTRKCEYLDR